jgi:hypothetical protein
LLFRSHDDHFAIGSDVGHLATEARFLIDRGAKALETGWANVLGKNNILNLKFI